MKITKKQFAVAIISMAILIVSLAITLADALVPLNFWIHPVLTFFFCAFVGFGILLIALGFIKSSPWYFFLSSILIGLALFYAMAQYLEWWLGLIIVGVIWIILATLSIISAGNGTEDIALNKSSDYKTYQERVEEKKKLEEQKPKEELPEIKSFK